MPKVRKEIPELEKLVQIGRKKFVRYEEGAQLYSMGLHTFQELEKDAKHVNLLSDIKYNGVVRKEEIVWQRWEEPCVM